MSVAVAYQRTTWILRIAQPVEEYPFPLPDLHRATKGRRKTR
jgi:hypothetical protein